MQKLSRLTLIFSLLFAVFFLLLIFFRIPFQLFPLMSYQDVFDLLTPLVLIPIYWLMYKTSSATETNRSGEIAFMILAAIWAMGHGIHLAANSIDNLSEGLAKSQGLDITTTDIYTLTYFLDENLSHYLWHTGILGMVALLSFREWKGSANQTTQWGVTIPAGMIYGFTYFCVFLEGQTAYLGFPFSILYSLLILLLGRKILPQKPLLAFFLVSCLLATALFIGWGIYWGGFPEFSDVGLI